jgi:amino acid adenylation domain-containing protein
MLSSPQRTPDAGISYPLSGLQQSMLFDSLLGDGGEGMGRGVQHAVFELDGTLDAERLQLAWQRVSDRHDALRTAFRLTNDGPVQDVAAAGIVVPFRVEDVALPHALERDWYVDACVQAEHVRGFVPGVAPLERVRLIRFGPDAQTLIWTNHHAIMDGRARAIVIRDLVATYAGRPLDRPATPYQAYISWLQNQDFAASEAFWRERLGGFTTATPLPAAFRVIPNGAPASLPGTVVRMVSGNDTAALHHLAREQGVSITVLLQAAWALLLSRHAATPDVVFGAVRAGRHSGIDGADAVGPMISILPIRTNVDESATVGPWLREAGSRWTALRPHEHVPQRLISGWSGIAGRQPLFESLLTYERETLSASLATTIDPGGVLGIRSARILDHTAFPLALVAAGTTELELRLQYDPGRFGRSDAERVLGHLVAILRSLPYHSREKVADVSMLSAPERERILASGYRETVYPRDATVHGLFAEHVARSPHSIAVQLGDETLTYAALAARAETVAAALRARGAGSGSFVGVHVERSFDMVAALLGILKAGAASIALDLSYPPERLTRLLAEAGVGVILSQPAKLPELTALLRTMAPETRPEAVDLTSLAEPEETFDLDAVRAEDPAHVMYTSGSTGIPKGAVLPHRAIVRTVRGTDYLRFAPDETFFAFVPLTFDVSVLELWGPLLNGARLVLCPPGLPSLDVLAATIEERGVTTLWLTTALFEQMVEEQLPRLHGLRQLIVGGDVMSPAHARRVKTAFPGLRLLNVYGPTEATVLITAQPLALPLDGPIPLGAPIPNASVYVLDGRGEPAPIGVPGEIYTGGDGVALGYLNRPDLTAERFVPDPFSQRPQATMYRSGDLARWRDDGTIDFLGRIDNQVKIRGVRIELGAIESALTEHPAVREAVVVAADLPPVGKQLIAYVVARESGLAVGELRAFLLQRLPRHSVPERVAFIDELPRTPTGKFDRKALPEPSGLLAEPAASERHEPCTPAQIAVAGHVAAVLGLEEIGLDDDFYAFGGDSLRAMRLIARLRSVFGVPLTMRAFVDAPTVAAVTAALSALQREPAESIASRVSPLRTTGTREPVFFMHGDLIGGGRYCNDIAERIGPDHPFYTIAPHGLDGAPIPSSIEAMARENCVEIRERFPGAPVILGGFCNGGIVAFEMARQLERAGIPVKGLTVVDGILLNAERSGGLTAFVRREAHRRLRQFGLSRTGKASNVNGRTTWEGWHAALVDTWYELLARYVARSYRGSISLLWTDEIAPRSEPLIRDWLRAAPNAAVGGRIPGTHLTSITRHLVRASTVVAASLRRHSTA